MNVKEYTTEISARLALRSFFIYAFSVSLLLNVILAVGLTALDKEDRVVNHQVFLAGCRQRLTGIFRTDGAVCAPAGFK